MKKRLVKKQMKKVVGYNVNGEPVYNCVSNPEYTGGSTPDEDYYRCEVRYTRKRHGAPLLIRNRWTTILRRVSWNSVFETPFKTAVKRTMQRLDDLGLAYPRRVVELAVAENWYEDADDGNDRESFITHVLQNI